MLELEEQISELKDVVAAISCKYEGFINELCQIIFVGEDTEIGRQITIDRIKEHINYYKWLDDLVMDEPIRTEPIRTRKNEIIGW